MDKTKYLYEFENKIIIEGFKKNIFGKRPDEIVPLKNKKLSNTMFSCFIQKSFSHPFLLAINYYGLFKLSKEVFKVVKSAENIFSEIRSIKCPVIHFNSIKTEHIKVLAPELLRDYLEFKKYIVDLRWNNNQG